MHAMPHHGQISRLFSFNAACYSEMGGGSRLTSYMQVGVGLCGYLYQAWIILLPKPCMHSVKVDNSKGCTEPPSSKILIAH